MDFDELKRQLELAALNGTLLTPKHDPYNLGTTFSSYRTVIAYDLADKLQNFISSAQYFVDEYENQRLPNSPLYFEITPKPESGFDIPASGVTACSIFATSVVDRIVAVSGINQGWHVFGEDSSVILRKTSQGDLLFKKRL
jgi:hypothetical protein